MSRAIIGGIVAIAIVVLTGTAYLVTTSRLETRIKQDVRIRVDKAQELLVQNASLEVLSLLRRVEDLARDESFLQALKETSPDRRARLADDGFQKFRSGAGGGQRTDILALLDIEGDLVVLQLNDEDQRVTNPGAWKESGVLRYPAVALALRPNPKDAQMTSDIWNHQGRGLMKVGVAPIVDYQENEVRGAVVVAYSLGSKEAQHQSDMLGTQVAYFQNDRVFGTSFRRSGSGEEDTTRQEKLLSALVDKGLSKRALTSGLADAIETSIDGEDYYVAAGRLRRFSSKKLPDGHPPASVGAMVMISLDEASGSLATVKASILLLGLGALVMAFIALTLTRKRFLHQADEIELGIAEIINGNLERTFPQVGAELDGLANALNVMLARLLGRPEPGEEEYDEHGNVVQADRLDFDTDLSPADSEAVALAQEPEPDYYKRLFGEYIGAREAAGQDVDGISFESFVTKLRVNEGNLKNKYKCSAIRFKVVVKGDNVTLKPVPIV